MDTRQQQNYPAPPPAALPQPSGGGLEVDSAQRWGRRQGTLQGEKGREMGSTLVFAGSMGGRGLLKSWPSQPLLGLSEAALV